MKAVRLGISACAFFFCSVWNLAQVSGSIATVDSGGALRQVFAHREDVFLAVGSLAAPCRSAEYLPDGKYYFQVTDPSGKRLLSTDPVAERAVTVKSGVISSYDGTTHTTDGRTVCDSLAVSLMPFADAGSRKAAYVLWMTPTARFEGNPSTVDPVCGDRCFHGFRPEFSRAFAFRVEDKKACDPTFCVSGVKFEDRNGNGLRETDEPGLAGVEIRVENENGLLLPALTAADGTYQICGLTPGDAFRVSEAVPFGYLQTAPRDRQVGKRVIARDFAYVLEACDRDVSGLDFGNRLIPGAIGGTKFEDLNANGVRDPGEPGLAGVVIALTPTDFQPPAVPRRTTDAAGNFLFTDVPPGNYRLSEAVPPGFTQTAPATGTIAVALPPGGSSLGNLFGNFRGILTGTISGFKFNDLNGNGVRDPGEPGMAGVRILLDPCASPGPCGPPPLVAVTGADGSFTFSDVRFGTYDVSETVPSGFRQTAPPPPGTYSVKLNIGEGSVTGLLFGNQALPATISGTKFNDLNGNGQRDPGEPGMPGVTIVLGSPLPTGTPIRTVTDASGNFSFTNVPAGSYILSEVAPSGFVQTAPPAPGTINVTVSSGQTVSGLLFGNRAAPATGSISGTKILDLNANGIVDGIDRPYEGIVMVLTDSSGVERRGTSGADGTFTFSNLPPGTYQLNEVLPPNFFQTFPGTPVAPKGYTITLAPGQNATGYLFLNKC